MNGLPPQPEPDMPPRTLLSYEQRTRLFAIPTDAPEMTRHYVLDAHDLALVGARRRAGNWLGFAVQLCALRHPGRVLDPSCCRPRQCSPSSQDRSGSIPRWRTMFFIIDGKLSNSRRIIIYRK